jgi:putative ABC transport system permease protein
LRRNVRVSGFAAKYLGLGINVNIESLPALLGEGQICTGAVIRLSSLEADAVKRTRDKLEDFAYVGSVQFNSEARANIEENMAPMSAFSFIMAFLSGIMSIAIVYNLTVINIHERSRELASLKVMGFTKKEVRRVIFDENLIIGVFSIILGLPLGRLICEFIVGIISTDAYIFPVVIYPSTYIYSVICIIAFILLAQGLLKKKIDRVDMIEVLKSRE